MKYEFKTRKYSNPIQNDMGEEEVVTSTYIDLLEDGTPIASFMSWKDAHEYVDRHGYVIS